MRNVLKKEFIGKTIEIVESKNKYNVGLKGQIIDETKYTFLICQKNKRQKRVFKKNIKFTFKIKKENKEIILKVFGSALLARPEDRIKRIKT